LLALIIVVCVAMLGVKWLTPKIEEDLHNRVTASLAEKGLLFAGVAVKGRDVTLLGDAPSLDAHDKAISAAAQVFGVARVRDGLSVKGVRSDEAEAVAAAAQADAVAAQGTQPFPEEEVKPSPVASTIKTINGKDYILTIEKAEDHVTISGMVPDEASKEVLHRIAVTHYGADKVTDKLTVVNGAPEGWRSAAGTVLFNIANLEKASATLSNTEVMVSGEALDDDFSNEVQDAIKKALPTSYKVAFAVDVNPPAEAPAIAPAEGPKTVAAVSPAEAAKPAEASETAPAAGGSATCAQVKDIRIHKIMFGFDRTQIGRVYGPTLKKVAGLINGCDGVTVTVDGYTDITGSKLYNKWLSEQRAEAGVRALMRDGVAKERLTAIGHGEGDPVGDNHTRSGRAANRRIEFNPNAGPGSISGMLEVSGSAVRQTVSGWWNRIGGAISRAETAVSATVASGTTAVVSATSK
jgi:outer membrane protein OmpA-like peptidoglycan-associated protein/osmotically-inducible protein OsmY